MKPLKATFIFSLAFVSACSSIDKRTIEGLLDVEIEVKDVDIQGGAQKAMQSYQQFLESTPDSAMTPDAIRRLADLNIEQEYGVINDTEKTSLSQPEIAKISPAEAATSNPATDKTSTAEDKAGSTKTAGDSATKAAITGPKEKDQPLILADGSNLEDLQTEGAQKAIALYLKLLKKFPDYERNDQVLYQLSRAYEETGQVEEAMRVMNRLIKEYPLSRHFPEVQFRRGEYFFTRKKLLDAEDAYKSLIDTGKGSEYFALALYKLGWTFYKQELYEEGLHNFIGLLDYKLSTGYDFESSTNDAEKKRHEDTYRVISLSFSNLGGPDAVISYFNKFGSRSYEHEVYAQLAEHYLIKRRYSDAAKTYNAFIEHNPFSKSSPHFSMRVIDIYQKGGFPRLVIEAKKAYSVTYGLRADYWKYFNPSQHEDVIAYLKKNIIDLANHYHALYQNKRLRDKRPANFKEASHWYREFLLSFPKDEESAGINYQLADLFLENKNFLLAAVEYEKTAYDYKLNEKSSEAGYSAVYAYSQHLKVVSAYEKLTIKRQVIRTSLKFVDVFPQHKKAVSILAAAADYLYELKDFQLAINASHKLIKNYPSIEQKQLRSSWLVIAYASFDLLIYNDAETAFINVLAIRLKDESKKQRLELQENLAAAVYKQGEQAVKLEDYALAASHFLRVGQLVPHSKIRSTADYDAATAFIQLKDWPRAAEVLVAFRKAYPSHKLQKEVTKKMAYVYQENKEYNNAAREYERIARDTLDNDIRRESLLTAADLYQKVPDQQNELRIYISFVKLFPNPVEDSLEISNKIATIYKSTNDRENYLKTLKHIIAVDAKAGKQRTDRTRYLAGMAQLAVIEPLYTNFVALKLVKPFKKNLKKKQNQMKANIKRYNNLVDYGVGDVTAAATYYIAETYYNFSRSLMESERPAKLSDLELEQYEIILEEQAYPFEEKTINIHKKNIELLSVGVYSQWIDKSLKKLGQLVPGRYAKYEESSGVLNSMLSYTYIVKKLAPVKPATEAPVTDKTDTAQSGVSDKEPTAEVNQQTAAPAINEPVNDEAKVPADAAVNNNATNAETEVKADAPATKEPAATVTDSQQTDEN
ncbi:MAG: tetratricopeptide repeat protein [Gammaproteobacteria bacterium]|nr:tetratricopeptide repeat protein [Gammaproteobacteria bacterium]